jgi:hypothetical protein
MSDYASGDIVIACADLVGRSGASDFLIGYLHDDVPVEEAGWYAYAQFRGARITVDDHRSPTDAALALAERLLRGATCRCRRAVTLTDGRDGCRWRLVGQRWEPGCDVAPVRVDGARGDYAAMRRAMAQPTNRAGRRKLGKGGRRA